MTKLDKTYDPRTDAAIQAREAVREEMEKQRQERRRSQVELIRLHFATSMMEGLATHIGRVCAEDVDGLLNMAWYYADAFIKKSEGQ